jgi:hypothetical protein
MRAVAEAMKYIPPPVVFASLFTARSEVPTTMRQFAVSPPPILALLPENSAGPSNTRLVLASAALMPPPTPLTLLMFATLPVKLAAEAKRTKADPPLLWLTAMPPPIVFALLSANSAGPRTVRLPPLTDTPPALVPVAVFLDTTNCPATVMFPLTHAPAPL